MRVEDRIPYTVKEGDPLPFVYKLGNGKCLIGEKVGDVILMRTSDYAEMCPTEPRTDPVSVAEWQDLCTIQGAYLPIENNMVVIAPEMTECIELDFGKTDCPPNRLYINRCGACLFAQVDAKPVLENNDTLTAPMINPEFLWIGENPETCKRPEKLYLHNPSTTDVMYVTLGPVQ